MTAADRERYNALTASPAAASAGDVRFLLDLIRRMDNNAQELTGLGQLGPKPTRGPKRGG